MEEIYTIHGTTTSPQDSSSKNPEEPKQSVKIVKTRKPVLRLTPDRLIADQNGLRALYTDIKYSLEVKGPGHEITDLKRLLNVYRAWHHKIMPKYTFGYFVKQLRVLGQKIEVVDSLEQFRNLHKGVLQTDTFEEKKGEVEEREIFGHLQEPGDGHQPSQQEDGDDLQEFLEEAQQQEQSQDSSLKVEKLKESCDSDNDDIDENDLEDILSL
ncbi:unnamed protein product [Moneuplotes crassus]|uniref:Chromosome segregation in meiosis protein 3 domain-containing protein n=1 Tax=Euplotes crassus TaxID=5936 RepID=A0AAD1Y0G0_EUPCR|nr:unnamed protein product [Moneuplotes crassus]